MRHKLFLPAEAIVRTKLQNMYASYAHLFFFFHASDSTSFGIVWTNLTTEIPLQRYFQCATTINKSSRQRQRPSSACVHVTRWQFARRQVLFKHIPPLCDKSTHAIKELAGARQLASIVTAILNQVHITALCTHTFTLTLSRDTNIAAQFRLRRRLFRDIEKAKFSS